MHALIPLILFIAFRANAAVDAAYDAQLHAGQTVTSIELTGHRITRDSVIYRELQTRVGSPLDLVHSPRRHTALRKPGYLFFGARAVCRRRARAEADIHRP